MLPDSLAKLSHNKDMGSNQSTCGKGTEVANFDFRDFRNTHRFRNCVNYVETCDISESLPYFKCEEKKNGNLERKWSLRWSIRRRESFEGEQKRSP